MESEYQNKQQDKRLDWLENHYAVFNSEFGEVKADVKWLKKAIWFISTTSVGTLITLLIQTFSK